MKQFLHASPLRSLALFAALAAFALPARADTLSLSYDDGWPCTMTVGDDPLEFTAIRGDTSASKTIRASSSNSTVVEVKPTSLTAAAGVDLVTFTLVAKKASTTPVTITVAIKDDAGSTATFPVTVNAAPGETSVTFTDVNNNPIGGFAALGEGETRTVLYKPSSVPFNVTPSTTDWADHVQYTANGGVVTITGLDGTYSFGLGFSDPDGIYEANSLNVLVTNKPPKISGSPDSKDPTILGGRRLKNQIYAFPASMFSPSDVAADMSKLRFTWSLSPASIDINGAFSNAWSSATEEGEYELFSVTVSDGNDSYTGYYALQITDTVPLFTDTTAPWAGLEKQGGIAQDTTFTAMDSAGNPIAWTLLGGRIGRALVGPNESVTLTAILEDGTYPFAWFGDKEQYLRAPNATRTPSPNLWAIVTMPEEGDVTVNYYASYPYYHTEPGKGAVNGLNTVLTDPFGDFDADGLSDTWEDTYFPVAVEKISANVESLPVAIPTGDYGPTGNRDDDWLPTSLFQPAPDGARKIGWPCEDPDNPGTTNRYKVYKYPLDFSTGGESYNKSAYDEKPLYGNFIEYRGLAENRTGDDGEDPKVFVYYAPEIVDANNTYGPRGNCSGTDPENYDTDGDGFSDGWEFYFWTTIKYRVNPQNWRAWDPTYSLYRTASASAGIPLLWTDEPVDFTFTIDPTPSYDIDPAAGTYRTTYEVDKDVIKNNKLIMPIAPGTVRIEFEGSAFYLVTQLGQLTTEGYDALFYQQWTDTDGDNVVDTPAVDPDTGDPILAPLDGAWVDGLTGLMHIPGWEVLSQIKDTKADDIGMATQATITYVRLNGIFTQTHLLSRFDPMDWTETDMGSVADVVKGLGLDEKKWDPDSDLDGDGVLDIEEYYLGTDPLHWDTDRDGMPDGWEVQRGLLPLDPRNNVNGCGPGDNPDEDYMAYDASGSYQHIYAYLADLSNLVYWNGSSYKGFVPGKAATTGAPYTNLREFLYSLYGLQSGIWFDAWRKPFMPPLYGEPSKYTKGIYPIDWPDTTSNPCDNDTDGDGLPDGWAAYVGINPIDTGLVTPLIVPPPDEADPDIDRLNWYAEFISVEVTNRWPETRTIYIGADATITQNASTTVGEDGSTNTVYSTTGTGTEVTIRGFQWPGSIANWTNKKRSTDPWDADTDGDGIDDMSEFTDPEDRNGDTVEFCNFDPTSVDTDLDWLPDNWEWFMGTYTPEQPTGVSTTDPYGPFGDPDGDGLANFQEYLTAANYGWRHDVWYPLDNQAIWPAQMRFDGDVKEQGGDWPYDPGLVPSAGPVVRPHKYTPRDFFMVPESPDWISKGLIAMKTLETRWSATVNESPSIGLENLAAYQQRLFEIVNNPFDNPLGVSKFMDDTRPSVDPDYNTDGEDIPGKKYFQYHSIEEHWSIVHAYEGIQGHLYSYAQRPYSWDTAALNNTPSGVPFSYIPLNDNSVACGFPGTRPKELDSDHDNMPDYWEIYHGLNPCYGGCIAISDKAGSVADGDWDGADNWMMGSDPNFVLNLRMIPAPAPSHRAGHVWYPFYPDTSIYQSFGDGESGPFGLLLERAHYDLVRRPWLAGDPSADCDHDGINNSEESYSVFANDLLHNTDPSPYWMTDITQTYEEFGQNASHVNLYYFAPGGSHYGDDGFELVSLKGVPNYWWWEQPYDANDGCNGPPTYIWDFEINEGYDSDNNNISDREELTDVSTRGKTDPQDLDSPISRKAMYFDGYAACRTQRPFFHDQYALTSFTVELWVRPQELPASGKIATLLQRPVMMPVDTISGAKAWGIRHTFLVYLNDKGQVCAEVDNDGIEQPANRAVVASAGRLVPGVWTHVALVMDSQNDRLALYLNGEQAGHVATSLKPCTGIIMDTSYQNWVTSDGGANGVQTVSTTTVNFQYSPAPIVLGAFDTTPWSVIGLNPDATFDRNRFFKGWIDEVRIWDRARSQSEILNNMSKRFKKADFAGINQARFQWDMENLYQTNSEDDFPQKLLYLYNFDNLPDVLRAYTRPVGSVTNNIYDSDTDPVPAGWPQIAATRPIPYVPWWYKTENRSTVYSADYSYVPFIENVVSHLPQRPPRGIKELVPVFDDDWNLAGYRYRLSADWSEELEADIIAGEQVIGDVEYQYEEDGSEALIAPTRIKNTMDPYGDTYSTGVSSMYEVSPWNFAGILDPYGVYEGVPIHSDMVPLLDAVADMDVPMWDGKGFGWDQVAIDSDGDGLPDWWEITHGLDPNSAAGIDGAYGDDDNDGLDNWAEYLAWTDPHAFDTDSDGYSDYYSRPNAHSLTYGELYDDGDGMDNAWEILHGLDPNRHDAYEDADGDGWTNWEEYMAGTTPEYADQSPRPSFSVEFHYSGENWSTADGAAAPTFVQSYGEKTAGRTMGGWYDGRYQSRIQELSLESLTAEEIRNSGLSSSIKIAGSEETFSVYKLKNGHIGAARVTYWPASQQSAATADVKDYEKDADYGLVFENERNEELVILDRARGIVYAKNATVLSAEYSVGGRSFPILSKGMSPVGTGSIHDHMVSGWNRFLGWLDTDGDGEWTPGVDPMGLSQPRPTLVSWDSVETTIPLSDSVWGYPRLSWPAVTFTGNVDPTYFVTFTWVRGASTRTETEAGSSYAATTGDTDSDGLEDWMEVLAGTEVNSKTGTTNDYYRIDAATGLFYGELYDDGDGIPTPWEMRYGLDPYRYDGNVDTDDDGWSNYAEFMAGTDPTKASSYPHPKLSATFYYRGKETDLACLGVYAYGEKTQGSTWGGSYDGRYTSTKGFSDGVVLGSDGSVTLDKWSDIGAEGTFAVNNLAHGLVESASIDVYVPNAEGALEVRTFTLQPGNAGMGVFTQDETGWILLALESGQVLSAGDYVGKEAVVSTSVRTYSFPVTFNGLVRNPEGNHTHMVEGVNRFLGWMDLDGDETYDEGEPMGLGLYAPTLVGWDSTSVEIPLTDSLWDYPRISWNDFSPTNFVATDYIVRFVMKGTTTEGTITTNTTEKTTTIGIYGDLDGDGLDAWMEAKAGTDLNKRDPDPDDPTSSAKDVTGRLQFDWVDKYGVLDPAMKATFGELLDDWDGLPAQWEMAYGLDPHLFDADADLDDDGWSNLAEFYANTDPTNPDDFPEPQFDVTFRYDGEVIGTSGLKVFAYSEKKQGSLLDGNQPATIYMGGHYDGLYTTISTSVGLWGDASLTYDALETTWGASWVGGTRISTATITFYGADGALIQAQASPFADDPRYGVFLDDGTGRIFIEWSSGMVLTQFYEEGGDATSIEGDEEGGGEGITIQPARSTKYAPNYRITFTVAGVEFPMSVPGLSRELGGMHNHMVEGYNRFLAFMDLNTSGTWDPGEPMGLSLYDATLVGWNSVVTEIPLTDELFGFPRISWPASTNDNVTSYKVYIWNDAGDLVVNDGGGDADKAGITIEAPRTFIHEGDYIEHGLRGIKLGALGSSDADRFTWTVVADNGLDSANEAVASGDFVLALSPNHGPRRTMEALSPVDDATLHGPLVELCWKMDWRTEGVFLTVKKGGQNGTAVINRLYVPFPVRHNKVTDDDYYYSYIPQLKNGRSLVSLGDGDYWWEVEENLRLDNYTAKKTSGTFRIEAGSDTTRSVASISGNVHYYGRLANAAGVFDAGKVVVLAYKVSDRATTSLSVSGNPVAKLTLNGAGSFEITDLEPGVYGLVGFVDANGNGLPDVGETQGMAFPGGSADPIQLPEWFSPIRIAVKDGAAVPVEDIHIVLRDRDLNGDGVPELFDGSLAQFRAKNVVTVPATAATNWVSTAVFDPNFKPYSSRTTTQTDIHGGGSSTEGGNEWQFVVRAPRTFLHEGDLARFGEYGFDLGNVNAADFTWEVVATDGYHVETNAGGAFSVFAGTDDTRDRLGLRWPVQNTVVHGSTVEFEWTMDHRNAGVEFKLESLDTGAVLFDGVIPFPVMHWDPMVQCYYYTAVPQMEKGLQFIDLPDGSYKYTVKERPNSGYVSPQSKSETFQVRNAENSLITGSISGDIWYFGRSMEAGDPPTWQSDLHLQAYKVSDAATSSASVGGELVADSVRNTNGAFRIPGLKAGTYSVFAFVDSNGNGIADEWETQGFGFFGGNASPVVVASTAVPIIVTNGASVTQVNVVLHDRDTDGDLLPDVWEYAMYGGLSVHNGYEEAVSNDYVRLAWNDPSILTNWSWRATNVVTRQIDIPETDTLRVRVDGPRTFLHEGDLLTPWILKNKWKGEREEGTYEGVPPGNVVPYLWKKDADGVWQRLDEPYYGFYLGSYSNSVVNWTVEAWDGADAVTVTGGSFRVVSAVGDARRPLLARYPTQKTTLQGNTVEFEWQMDDRNAGVLFDLWKVGDLENGPITNALGDPQPLQIITNMVVAFPIRHGLPGTDDCYYSAIPQLDDGTQLDEDTGKRPWIPDIGKTPIQLPGDGLYMYRITERPQSDLVDPLSFTEYFQIDNSGDNRGLYSAEGSIRYYGKVMQRTVVTNFNQQTDGVTSKYSFTVDRSALQPGAMAILLVRDYDPGSAEITNNWYYVTNGVPEIDDQNVDLASDWAAEVFNDSVGNAHNGGIGPLYPAGVYNGADGTETDTTAWSGWIDYGTYGTDDTGSIELEFNPAPADGLDILLVRKDFPVPCYLQVYKLPDEAQTCVSVAGVPVRQIKRDPNAKGAFTIENLEAGKYAIRAFLDSNGNGYCDDWETQGIAVQSGTVSPNLDPEAAPIEVGGKANNVTGLMIVLHDRDTDNDLLPDSWEFWKRGNLLTSGYDVSDAGGLLWFQEYADGVLDSDPRTPDTDLDGLTDAMEILVTGTDTHLLDTDGDGVGDLEEFLAGSDPLDPAVARRYALPALAFDADGVPYVDLPYPALRPGVVLTYELQRKLSLGEDEAWETVAEHDVANDGGAVYYTRYDGVNDHLSEAGTARMWPADQAEGVDFTAGFYRVKIYADYGKMVDNGDGTWSYWTWVKTSENRYEFKEAARGEGTLVRDADGNWRFVDPDSKKSSGSLYRDPDGGWKFVQ